MLISIFFTVIAGLVMLFMFILATVQVKCPRCEQLMQYDPVTETLSCTNKSCNRVIRIRDLR